MGRVLERAGTRATSPSEPGDPPPRLCGSRGNMRRVTVRTPPPMVRLWRGAAPGGVGMRSQRVGPHGRATAEHTPLASRSTNPNELGPGDPLPHLPPSSPSPSCCRLGQRHRDLHHGHLQVWRSDRKNDQHRWRYRQRPLFAAAAADDRLPPGVPALVARLRAAPSTASQPGSAPTSPYSPTGTPRPSTSRPSTSSSITPTRAGPQPVAPAGQVAPRPARTTSCSSSSRIAAFVAMVIRLVRDPVHRSVPPGHVRLRRRRRPLGPARPSLRDFPSSPTATRVQPPLTRTVGRIAAPCEGPSDRSRFSG